MNPTTLTPTMVRHGWGVTRRIVMANVVGESSLPYGMAAMDYPEKCHEVWRAVVEKCPEFEPEKEQLVIFLLNSRLAPFAWHRVSLGGCSETSAHPREILRPVIAANAHGFVLMHNHPSGDPSPSIADERVTRRLLEAATLMQVSFLDHVIIGQPMPGRSPYYSFREAGMI
jgi:DNA repair protein RadC